MTKKTNGEKPQHERKRRKKDVDADWGTIDGELLRKVIEAITRDGGAVRFGYSRDGGAYSIGIYGDGKPFTEFHPAGDGVPDWIEGIAYDYE